MVTITCDICKKKMDNPINDRTFFRYAETSICEPCKDNLEYAVRTQIRGKDPFTMDWYEKTMKDACGKACQKGKV